MLFHASREDDAFQLFFPRNGDPQRVTQPHKQPEDGVGGKSLQVLFDSFSAEQQFLREGRLHRKVGPFLGGLLVSQVPHHSVKPGGHLVLRAGVRIRLEPHTDAARDSLLRERLLRFLQQYFARSTLQGRAGHASPARFFLRFFSPNVHSLARRLRHSRQVLTAPAQEMERNRESP